MWAVTCIVLSAGAPSRELSYFSKEDLPEGSVITIPLRGKDALGLVLKSQSVAQLRQNIRSSTFSLRKLTNPKPRSVLSRPFLRALFEASMSLACPPGALIYAYTSQPILTSRTQLPESTMQPETLSGATHELLLFVHTHEERVSEYKRLARESLARNTSLLIIVPTIAEAESLGAALTIGIRDYVTIVHSALSKKKLLERWQHASTSKHALVVIGTPMTLSLDRSDFSTIILEREGSSSYNREERPYAQTKIVAEAYAHYSGARLILAATSPSVESVFRKVEGEIQDLTHPLSRLTGAETQIIDLREHKKEKGYYDPLTPALLNKMQTYVAQKKPVLVLAARRGLAPLTCCDDCGTVLACTRCKTALVLHAQKGSSSRKFLCHHCGDEEPASIRCSKCGGWRLTTLGIAIDGVAQSLEKHFPASPLCVLSADTKTNEVKAVQAWQEKGGILLATERVLPYLPDAIPAVAIASIDSFLSIPEYSASERVLTLLAELKSRATETLIIQTRDPLHRVMRALREGSATAFYKDELADRKQFQYPPFTTLIRITSSGKKEVVEKEIEEIFKALEHLSPMRLAGKATARASTRTHILLRLPRGSWVDQRLLRFIRNLPPHIEVRVNPSAIHSN